MDKSNDITKEEKRFLKCLSDSFPRIATALERIANTMEIRTNSKEHHNGKGRPQVRTHVQGGAN